MRLLIVNPNTSQGVTARIAEAAQAVALPTDDFTTVSAAFGPELIVTEEDARHAIKGVVATVEAHEGPVDGIILASFGDTGAREIRRLRPGTPVIGIAGAAFATVRALGGTFGIVTFGDSVAPPLLRKVEETGLADSFLGIASVKDGDKGDPGKVQSRLHAELKALCHDIVNRGADAIVLGGGPLAGLARTLGPSIPVPIVDGTQAAIGLMRAAADQKQIDTAHNVSMPIW